MKHLLAVVVRILRNVNRAVEAVLIPIYILMVALMLATVVWGVTARLTGISAPWTDKAMLILLPSLAFLVAPVAYRRSANVALDLLRDSLSPTMRNVHGLLMHLGILVILLIGLDLTLRKVGVDPGPVAEVIRMTTGPDLSEIRPFATPMRIPVINVQWKYVYMVMPVCITLMILGNVELILRHVLAFLDPRYELVRPVRSVEDSETKLWD